MPVEGQAALDTGADLVAQHDKVADRAEMDVRRVVPGIVEDFGDRHPPAKEQAEANPPEAEIRKRHDRPLTDAQQLFEHQPRLARRLQGLAQYDDIESAVRKGFEVAVGIAL